MTVEVEFVSCMGLALVCILRVGATLTSTRAGRWYRRRESRCVAIVKAVAMLSSPLLTTTTTSDPNTLTHVRAVLQYVAEAEDLPGLLESDSCNSCGALLHGCGEAARGTTVELLSHDMLSTLSIQKVAPMPRIIECDVFNEMCTDDTLACIPLYKTSAVMHKGKNTTCRVIIRTTCSQEAEGTLELSRSRDGVQITSHSTKGKRKIITCSTSPPPRTLDALFGVGDTTDADARDPAGGGELSTLIRSGVASVLETSATVKSILSAAATPLKGSVVVDVARYHGRRQDKIGVGADVHAVSAGCICKQRSPKGCTVRAVLSVCGTRLVKDSRGRMVCPRHYESKSPLTSVAGHCGVGACLKLQCRHDKDIKYKAPSSVWITTLSAKQRAVISQLCILAKPDEQPLASSAVSTSDKLESQLRESIKELLREREESQAAKQRTKRGVAK